MKEIKYLTRNNRELRIDFKQPETGELNLKIPIKYLS